MEFPKTMYTPDGKAAMEVNNKQEYESCVNGGWLDAISASAFDEPEPVEKETPIEEEEERESEP